MPSSGTLFRMDLVITDVSEERIASIIRVTRIGELGTTLAVTSNWSTLPILVNLVMEALPSTETRFLQESHSVTSQNTTFLKWLVGWKMGSSSWEGLQDTPLRSVKLWISQSTIYRTIQKKLREHFDRKWRYMFPFKKTCEKMEGIWFVGPTSIRTPCAVCGWPGKCHRSCLHVTSHSACRRMCLYTFLLLFP
jgi:hypothetical protein